MAKLTRSGIAHDLTISPYRYEVMYGEGNSLTYIFSSNLYRNKFMEKIGPNRDMIGKALSKRYGFKITNDLISDIRLYAKTETRGFLIKGKEEYRCLEEIEVNGESLK